VKQELLAHLLVEYASPVPIYEQIKRRIKQAIAQGALRPGEELPSIRELALLLHVNPNTVARAFRDLSWEGVADGRAGKGFWVNEQKPDVSQNIPLFREEFLRLMEKAVNMGIPRETLREVVNEFFREES